MTDVKALADRYAETLPDAAAKRAKYESIKQGMMQELLTGKTRLLPSACARAGAEGLWRMSRATESRQDHGR